MSLSDGLNATAPELQVLLTDIGTPGPNEGGDGNHIQASFNTATRFSQYLPEQKMGFANQIRTLCGGSLGDVPSSTDPVLQSLRAIAHDMWPTYLLPPPAEGPRTFWMSSGPVGIYQHPELATLHRNFANDETLRPLFPSLTVPEDAADWTKWIDVQAVWTLNAGSGGSHQMMGVFGSLLLDAVLRTRLSDGELTHDGLMRELAVSLNAFRKLATKKPVHVPAIVGLSGVQLEDGQQIELASGIIRKISDLERDLLLNSSNLVTTVFETTFPLQILDISNFDPTDDKWHKTYQKYGPRFEESHRAFQHSLDQVRLAILLCSEGEEYLGSVEVSRFIFNPTQPGGSATWTMDQRQPASYIIPQTKFDEIKEWHSLIGTKHPDSLNIAMKRLLSAASQRADSNDAFIDALIVWENAFGTTTETAFRVTGALAKLLEPDDMEKRLELQKELANLYGIRSRLVHGAKEPAASKSWEYRQRTISIAIDCLRRLYRERPDLLSISSEDRSKRLLLEH
ncbi:HEPN domain-containing protein [Arthrobacter glacialis]|uniref:HEPN domain-containing protein n=1 Tax=Arthrobacter glacialis TaxID=1664 RepID=UPI0013FDAF1D|nr:HEPN domain-containing protein [Arthrobacter glacialis]